MTERSIRVMTTASVLLVAAIAACISYIHIAHLAVTHGQDHIAAVLLPLSIDGLVAAMSGYMFRCARRSVPIPWLARFMLALAVAATLAANVLYGIHWGVTGALISGWPAVAFVGCVEVSVLMVRKTRPVVVAGPGPAEPVEVPAVSPGPATMTVKQQAKHVTSRATSSRHRNDKLIRLLLSQPDLTEPELASKAGCSVSTVSRAKRKLAQGDMVTANGNGKAH
jgi:Protein of unknown function (DUF2637)